MKTISILPILIAALAISVPVIRATENDKNAAGKPAASAQEKPGDSAIKRKLLGYWKSPRHPYLFKSDGIVRMCPTSICTTTNTWDVIDGIFYWDAIPYEIVKLTDNELLFRPVGKRDQGPYMIDRITRKEAE